MEVLPKQDVRDEHNWLGLIISSLSEIPFAEDELNQDVLCLKTPDWL